MKNNYKVTVEKLETGEKLEIEIEARYITEHVARFIAEQILKDKAFQ